MRHYLPSCIDSTLTARIQALRRICSVRNNMCAPGGSRPRRFRRIGSKAAKVKLNLAIVTKGIKSIVDPRWPTAVFSRGPSPPMSTNILRRLTCLGQILLLPVLK
jgi:hypothetical protein